MPVERVATRSSLFLLIDDFRWKDMKVRCLNLELATKIEILTICIDAHHHWCCNYSHSSHHHCVHRSCDKPLVVDSHSTTALDFSCTVAQRSHLRRVVVSMRFYNSLDSLDGSEE